MEASATATWSPRNWRQAPAPRAPDCSVGDVLLADRRRDRHERRRMSSSPPLQPSRDDRCTTRSCAQRTQQMVDISVEPVPSSPRGLYFALAAVGDVLAARRRLRAAAPSRSPGDAAFLLADGRVLRRDGVLVHRPARSRSTGSSTGGTCRRSSCCRRCSCTSRSSFPIGPTRGCGATPGARCCPPSICRRCCLGGASVAGVINAARAR